MSELNLNVKLSDCFKKVTDADARKEKAAERAAELQHHYKGVIHNLEGQAVRIRKQVAAAMATGSAENLNKQIELFNEIKRQLEFNNSMLELVS